MRPRAGYVLRGRLPRPGDDSGNIAMVLMAIIVGATIGSLMMAMVLNQNSATRFDSSRVRALDAAQAGLDVMLGKLRNPTTTDSSGTKFGNSDSLPCASIAAPMTGAANATGTMTYSVSVVYYRTDPITGAIVMPCSVGFGPFDPATGAHTPRYAQIASTGVDSSNPNSASKGRTLTTTFVFRTDDVNIPGGQIQIYPDGSGNKWCMDAGSATPGVGTPVVLRACSTTQPPAAQQVFAYRSDLSIQLVSSVTTAVPTGLCLDTSPTAHAAGDVIVLNTCNAPGTAAYNQQWSVDDNAHLRGALVTKANTDGYCIAAASQTNLQAVTLAACAGDTTDVAQTWVPTETTGPGMAGATNNQIVNYQNFATCIDVTQKNPASAFLILFTCKQNPLAANVAWNQEFSPALGPTSPTAGPQVGKLTTNNGTAYCLQDPAVKDGYVTVSTACSSTWTWYQTKDAAGAALPYAQKYTIVDSAGLCLAPGRSNDLYNQYYKIIVTTCDGQTDQKWNADPSELPRRLSRLSE